jgi:aspartyl-tRNA(Asn)/glutamyl-tRNA(Gln) amidotransferase subunit C
MFYICLMKVNDELIEKLAHLSRLEFNEAEKEDIKKDLEKMIGFIDKLNELDTTGVEPLLHMSENVNILREDEITGMVSREDALKNAPLHDDRFFKVPKVIKNKEALRGKN